jgi:hypothetical protein
MIMHSTVGDTFDAWLETCDIEGVGAISTLTHPASSVASTITIWLMLCAPSRPTSAGLREQESLGLLSSWS